MDASSASTCAEPSFRHVLLTRFNVRMKWLNDARGVSDDWLEHRFRLFDRFCFPTVASQTCTEFLWLVFFDAQTPEVWRDRIEQYRKRCPAFTPVYVELFDWFALRAAMTEAVPAGSVRDLITTRLDNDDSIARDFVERVQAAWDPSQTAMRFLTFDRGLFYRDEKAYETVYENNPFLTMIEPLEKPKTALHFNHIEALEHGAMSTMGGAPGWLIVVHERNVLNRVRGVRVSLDAVRAGFAIDEVPEHESRLGVAAARFLTGVIWNAWRGVRGVRRALRRDPGSDQRV